MMPKYEREGENYYNSTHNKRIRMPESEAEESFGGRDGGRGAGIKRLREKTVV